MYQYCWCLPTAVCRPSAANLDPNIQTGLEFLGSPVKPVPARKVARKLKGGVMQA